MDIKQLNDEFQKLNLWDQRKKLISMTEQIKDSNPLFLELYQLLTTKEILDWNFLIWIYEDILNLSFALKNYNKQEQQKWFASIQEKIQEMRELENIEHTKDLEEAEDLLSSI